ncbi:hypothetical protein [Phenylobacterium montanum]|uniref:Uncharacterized protein n=1 Tax=Phenylobacterium montanum TaxID=2823693 RepID=A0A975IXG1_9CAUL|nr:hypothetical protein [Caulobacter sp. S6]QUD90948.1 hypothetical protein KCG34_25665 [Caulobacter sp. S6]
MRLEIGEIDITIYKIVGKRREAEYGGRGWFWSDTRIPPVGPFATSMGALLNMVMQFESGEMAERINAAEDKFERFRQARLAAENGDKA